MRGYRWAAALGAAAAITGASLTGCSGAPDPLRLHGEPIHAAHALEGITAWHLRTPDLVGEDRCHGPDSCNPTAVGERDGQALIEAPDAHRLLGLDLRRGSVMWSRPWSQEVWTTCDPLPHRLWACVRSADDAGRAAHLLVLDGHDGRIVHDHVIPHARGPHPRLTVHASSIWTVSTVSDSSIFRSTTRTLHVTRFDAKTRVRWSKPVHVDGARDPHVVLRDGRLALVDPTEGALEDTRKTTDQVWLDPATGDPARGNTDPIVSMTGGVIVTHRKGEPITVGGASLPDSDNLRFVLPKALDTWRGAPIFAHSTTSDTEDALHAYDPTDPSAQRWTRQHADPLAYCDGVLLLSADEHIGSVPAWIERVDPATGKKRWKVKQAFPDDAWCGRDAVVMMTSGDGGTDVVVRRLKDGSLVRRTHIPRSTHPGHSPLASTGRQGALFVLPTGVTLIR